MEITVLSDNRSLDGTRFHSEHGLSILLRSGDECILLDTGASDSFLRNAAVLGLDLGDVDHVFLSHGHNDHCGGLASFLKINSKAKVIVSPEAISGSFFSKRGYLHSISPSWPLEEMEGRTILVEKEMFLGSGIKILRDFPHLYPQPRGNRNLLVRERDGTYVQDIFLHEMALYYDGLLFTGCAHNGIENILSACPWEVKVVLGGFHLLDSTEGESYEKEEDLRSTARHISASYPETLFYTGHCTGERSFEILRSVLGERLHLLSCGMSLSV